MSQLLVRITGLCAFVPKHAIREIPKDNQMRLLLVESNRPSDLPDGHAFHAHEPHVPVFLCPYQNVDQDKKYRQPDVVFGSTAAFYLDDQDLKIKNAKDNSLEVVLKNNAGRGCPEVDPEKGNITSFEWVAPLAEVSPGSGKIPDSCFCSSEVDPSVIARVELREGKILTEHLACDSSDRNAIVWEYKIPYSLKRGCHYQVAADVVRFEVDIEDSVVLITTPLRSNFSNVRVRDAFHPKAVLPIRLMTKEADIYTWVKNMPWADIFGTREPQRYEDEPDIHFSHFYKLSSEYKDANVPHAYGRCPLPVPHLGNPNCQPARTEPNPNA